MRCRGLESSLCLVLAAIATAGCASLPDARSLMPGGAAKTNQTLDAQLAMARLSERHGDTRAAEQIYRGVLEKDPRNPLALHRLGVLAARMGENEQAAKHLQAAAQLGPPSSELLNDIGFNLFVMRQLPEAEAVFRQAITADPQNKAARNNLGLVLGETQRYDESLAEFRRGNDEAEAQANLAYAQTQAGDLAGAKSSYDRALTLNKELKPAAEALVQLAQQRTLPNDGNSRATESGRTNTSGEFERRRRGETAGYEKTLPELVQEGQNAHFLESVTERDRITGRAETFRPPAETAHPVAQAAYFSDDRAASREARRSLAEMPDAERRQIARVAASSTPGPSPTVGPGGSFVLSRVFRFPDKAQPASVPMRTRGTTRPDEPAAAKLPNSPRQSLSKRSESTRAVEPSAIWSAPTQQVTQQHPKRNGNLLSSFEPQPARHPLAPTAASETAVSAPTNAPSEPGFAAPGRLLASAPQTASISPWQAPTWTPDFTGVFSSAAAASSSTASHDTPLPPPPLATPFP